MGNREETLQGCGILGHMGEDHVYYNGIHASDFVTPKGLTKFSIHDLPPIVIRGILLDMTIF